MAAETLSPCRKKRRRPMTSHSERRPALELDCQTAFHALAQDCVVQMAACRSTAATADPEAIHQMRMSYRQILVMGRAGQAAAVMG